jgi:hypothetical protein
LDNQKIYASHAAIEVEQTPFVKTIEPALLSDTLLLRVVKANGLDKDPVFAPPKKDGSAYLEASLPANVRIHYPSTYSSRRRRALWTFML